MTTLAHLAHPLLYSLIGRRIGGNYRIALNREFDANRLSKAAHAACNQCNTRLVSFHIRLSCGEDNDVSVELADRFGYRGKCLEKQRLVGTFHDVCPTREAWFCLARR